MVERHRAEALPDSGLGGVPAKPWSARTGLVVVLTFHGMIIAQAAFVLLRLAPQWGETHGEAATNLPVVTRFLLAISTWVVDHPFERVGLLLVFLGLDAGAFLLTWRLGSKDAVGWWMRVSVVLGIVLLVWLYGSLYLPMFAQGNL